MGGKMWHGTRGKGREGKHTDRDKKFIDQSTPPRDGEGWATRGENKGKVTLLKSNIWDMGSFLSHLP